MFVHSLNCPKIVCELLIAPVFMLILVLNFPLPQFVKSSTVSLSTFIEVRSFIARPKSRGTVDCGLSSAKVCSRTLGTSRFVDNSRPVNNTIYGTGRALRVNDAKEIAAEEAWHALREICNIKEAV